MRKPAREGGEKYESGFDFLCLLGTFVVLGLVIILTSCPRGADLIHVYLRVLHGHLGKIILQHGVCCSSVSWLKPTSPELLVMAVVWSACSHRGRCVGTKVARCAVARLFSQGCHMSLAHSSATSDTLSLY